MTITAMISHSLLALLFPYLKQNFVCSCQIPRKNPEPEDEQEIDEEPGDPVPPEGLGNPLGAVLPDSKI